MSDNNIRKSVRCQLLPTFHVNEKVERISSLNMSTSFYPSIIPAMQNAPPLRYMKRMIFFQLCQLTPTDEQQNAKNWRNNLRSENLCNESAKMKQIGQGHETKTARTSSTFAYHTQFIHFSKPVNFKGKRHGLSRAAGGISTIRKRTGPNICRRYNRFFICFVCGEIEGTSFASGSKGPRSSCSRVPLSQQATNVRIGPTSIRAFVCFWCMMQIAFINSCDNVDIL